MTKATWDPEFTPSYTPIHQMQIRLAERYR
jgi:hypothetical protein